MFTITTTTTIAAAARIGNETKQTAGYSWAKTTCNTKESNVNKHWIVKHLTVMALAK